MICLIKPLGRETRKHPPAPIRKLQASIEQFGFVLPIVIGASSCVVAGWGLALAAKKLGLREVPAVTITGFDDAIGRAEPPQCNGREETDYDTRDGEAGAAVSAQNISPHGHDRPAAPAPPPLAMRATASWRSALSGW
ncbi:MAG TPA: ParB N-terminal domain-containing protein [Methylocella sp.]|nr:ParB N-terminal domain-containing protein [Methylocella sp.]